MVLVLGVRCSGSLYWFGAGASGQGGVKDTRPVQAGTATRWNSVSAGLDHACGTRSDMTLWCWGRNSNEQLGDATYVDKSSAVQVPGAAAAAVFAGPLVNATFFVV